jgi:hypothetical protein
VVLGGDSLVTFGTQKAEFTMEGVVGLPRGERLGVGELATGVRRRHELELVQDDTLEVQPTLDKAREGDRRDVVDVAVVARQRDPCDWAKEGESEVERLIAEL